MIKLEKTQVNGLEPAIRGMRNPMNSWEKSDTIFVDDCGEGYNIFGDLFNDQFDVDPGTVDIGPNDHDLMMRLAKAGTEHSKYRRMIVVYVDITAPLYWWKEFDTYKVGTVANSCSTMHKIHAKEFTLDDFSCEHLIPPADPSEFVKDIEEVPEFAGIAVTKNGDLAYYTASHFMYMTIDVLNHYRELYVKTKDKRYWWQMIQLLPTSYNQKRTVMLNYENLASIYRQRKDHKLDEWHTFCDWIKELPYSELITLEEE